MPGTTYESWPTAHSTLGVATCKDMDFPPPGREYGARGVGLLFVPAWDFVVDGWYHSRMAIMRGVESGFSIVRVAKQGLHTVTDNRDRGCRISPAPPTASPSPTPSRRSPTRTRSTPAGVTGSAWVAIACLAWTLIDIAFTSGGSLQR